MKRSTSYTLIGLFVMATIAAATGFLQQRRDASGLRAQLHHAQARTAELQTLRRENQRLRETQLPDAELEKLREDRTAVQKLRTEIDTLRKRAAGIRETDEAQARRATQTAAGGRTAVLSAGLSIPGATRGSVDTQYGELIGQLKLASPWEERFKHLLVARQQAQQNAVNTAIQHGRDPNAMSVRHQAGAAMAAVEQQMRAEFGDTFYAAFREFEWTLAARNIVTSLDRTLASTPSPLTSDQFKRLMQILAQARDDSGGVAPLYRIRITNETLQLASAVLSAEQLRGLELFQERAPGSRGP